MLTRQTVVTPSAPSFLPLPINGYRQVDRAVSSLHGLHILHSTANKIKIFEKKLNQILSV